MRHLDSDRNMRLRSATGESRSAVVQTFQPSLALWAAAWAIQGATANAALRAPGSSFDQAGGLIFVEIRLGAW